MFQKPGATGVEGISLLSINKQANAAYDQVPASDGAGSAGAARVQKSDDDDEDNIQVDIDESLMNTGEEGLDTSEANDRLERFGRNELEDKVKPKWKVFLGHFTGPMPCMIWAAIFIEGFLIGDWPNFWVLLFLQCLNGTVGFYEDSKAGDAVAALKASLKPEAQVKRDGRWKNFPAGELVPGDRVALNAGAAVPADCRICAGTPIEIDQAALTGESLPVTMYPGDVAKMGSTVTRGEIDAIVACTGKNTFFGKTAAMIQSVDEMGNFQKVLLKITMFLLIVSSVLVVIAMGYLIAHGEDFFHALAFGVVLLVASIPIAMQVVCTTTMALGSRKLADQKAIVARLSSIEQMASMTILCSDKTGTLTLNKMVLQDILPYQSGATENDCLQCAALAAKWKEPAKDALDTLVLNAVDKGPLDAFEQLDYTPFDPVRKRTEAKLRAPDGRVFNVMKGAPNVVLSYCENKEDIRAEFEESVQNFAERGIRALAVARGFEPGGLVMVGLLTFLDPPRPDTKRTIERAIEQGIGVKMITGDHAAIAKETARTLGMGDNILLPTELPNYDSRVELPKTLGDDYGEMIENSDGFAQVFPEHKFLIVEALRQKGYSCGMTGDGVNDAPALKRADVGIAVQGSTDAARAAADLILTAPGLSVIVDAIIISRCIFQRMKNYVIYRVACTIQLLAFFFLAVLTIHPKDYVGIGDATFFNLPVVALVVITILNDGTIISIAYDHVEPSPRPERWNLPILFAVATWLGFVAVSSSMLLLHWALDSHSPDSTFQTMFGIKDLSLQHVKCMVYLKISLSDFFTVFTARTQGVFWERVPGTLLMGCACLATISSTLLSMNWPFGEVQKDGSYDMESIDGGIAFFTWVYCFAWFLIQDVMKVVLYKVLFHFDVSGLRTESEKCAERAYATSPEARIGKLEEELGKMKQVVAAMGQSNFQAVKLAANGAL